MDKLALPFWAAVDAVTVNIALLEFRNALVAIGTSSATASWLVFGGGYAFLGLLGLGTWLLTRNGRPARATTERVRRR
jgi:hypothetical protein